MQKIVLFLLFFFSGLASFSQQGFFIYLQADNQQPFYARIASRMYSSTENGYMIIPKLGDSTYQLTIGFAKKSSPEQNFSVPINKKDKGFQLKNMGDSRWALVNLQNASVITSSGMSAGTVNEMSGTRKTDAFSAMLASVVNDSAILYSPVRPKPVEQEIVKKQPAAKAPAEDKAVVKDSIQATDNTASVEPVKKEAVEKREPAATEATPPPVEATAKTTTPPATQATAPAQDQSKQETNITDANNAKQPETEKPFITRIEERNANGQYEAVYLEQYVLHTDTVRVTIPVQNTDTNITTPAPVVVETKPAQVIDSNNTKEEIKQPAPATKAADSPVVVKKTLQITNSDCKGLATDYDVDKLRVKLLNDKNVDDQLATAKKFFKSKCLTVKQVKALTELFTSDETRYRFFDSSYPFVSDTSNFYELEALILNDYYKNRFKAMINK